MRNYIRALALAGAICVGIMPPAAGQQFPSGAVQGNGTSSTAPGKPTDINSVLYQKAGSDSCVFRRNSTSVACGSIDLSQSNAVGSSILPQGNGGTGAASASAARTALGLEIGLNVQSYDVDLAALAGLTSADNKCFYWTGVGTAANFDCSPYGRGLINAADASTARTALGAVIGTDVQAYDADLAALAGLTSANNKCFYWTGTATAATYDCTSFGRSVQNVADAAALRTLAGSVIGTNVQAYDADLTTWAGLTPSANAQSLVTAADYAAMRSLLGLVIGTNVQAYDADLTTWAGLTPSANAQSLVTAADYAAMRSLLGLVIGTNVQAYDALLAAIAGLTTAQHDVIVATGVDTVAVKSLPDCTDSGGNHLNYTRSTQAFSCGNSGSGGGGSVGTDDYVQLMLNSMANARAASLAQFFGSRFVDSFGALTYVNTGAATNLNSSTSGLLKPSVSGSTSYANTGGTGDRTASITVTYATLTSSTGFTNLVDGGVGDNSTDSSIINTGPDTGYIQFDFGSGNTKYIDEITWKQSTTDTHGTWKWAGSNDGSSFTDQGSSFSLGGSTTQVIPITPDGTLYRYFRLIKVSGSSSDVPWLREIEFKLSSSAPAYADLTVQSTSIAVAAEPASCVIYARVKHVDSATAGTDYNFYISRDGGSTFSTAASMTDYFTDPTDSAHVLYSASVDVSGQPSGSNVVVKFETDNAKNLELRDWGFRCAA